MPLEHRVLKKILTRLKVEHSQTGEKMLECLESERSLQLIKQVHSTVHSPLFSNGAVQLGFFRGAGM